MKIFWRVVVALLIIVPIFMCWKTLQTVWEDDTLMESGEYNNDLLFSGDELQHVQDLINDEEKRVTADNLGDGVEYDITGLNIISKVYERAEVAISLANVYEDHDETSKVLGKLEKGSLITIQNYDNGWSTVTNYTLSGWMKTENIKLPESDVNMVITPSGESGAKTGTVKVDDSLNVRASASRTADIIGSLSNGTIVNILETQSGWYKVKVGNITGWVSADYVTVR